MFRLGWWLIWWQNHLGWQAGRQCIYINCFFFFTDSFLAGWSIKSNHLARSFAGYFNANYLIAILMDFLLSTRLECGKFCFICCYSVHMKRLEDVHEWLWFLLSYWDVVVVVAVVDRHLLGGREFINFLFLHSLHILC